MLYLLCWISCLAEVWHLCVFNVIISEIKNDKVANQCKWFAVNELQHAKTLMGFSEGLSLDISHEHWAEYLPALSAGMNSPILREKLPLQHQ